MLQIAPQIVHRAKVFFILYFCKVLWVPRVILKRRKTVTVSARNSLEGDKIAIFAIFEQATSAYTESLTRVANFLEMNSFSVLVISNGEITPRTLKILDRPKFVVLKRSAKGRDFAAYQAGIKYLKEKGQFHSLESLILLNDSMYWSQGSEVIFSKSMDLDFGCMFLTTHPRTHAQSFFLVFSRDLINSKTFQKFWEKYVPLNSKVHNILQGELGLSKQLISAGFQPESIIDAEFMRKSVVENSILYISELELLGQPEFQGSPPAPRALKILLDRNVSFFPEVYELETDNIKTLAQRAVLDRIHYRGPHTLGLVLHKIERVPIKFDTFKYYPLGVIAHFSSHLFYEDQLKRQSDYMQAGLKNTWKRMSRQI